MPTFSNKKLIKPLFIPTVSGSLIYTVPGSLSTILTVITVDNTTASLLHFNIHLCDQNDSASEENALLYDAELDPKTVANFNFGQVLSSGDKVRASADAIGISLHMSGIEISP
jgi:hypothetical protein